MSSESHTGGCFCGRIRFRFDGTVRAIANCHCTMCRRTSAAPYVTWVMTAKSGFHFESGEPVELESSTHGRRHFCGECGTPLTCTLEEHPEWVDVTVGSLDHPESFPPNGEYYTDTRLPWVEPLPKENARADEQGD